MKLFNKLFLVAVALISGLAFTACEEDNEYTPGAQSAGVYFDVTPSVIELLPDATSFDIVVKRTGDTSAATYGITADYIDLFTVPESVTFADGADATTLTITFDPADLEVGIKIPFVISLAEGTPAMAYGKSTVEFEIVLTPKWSNWEKMTEGQAVGTGYYVYEADPHIGPFFVGQLGFDQIDSNLPADVRYDENNPTSKQLRVSHWGYNVDLLLSYVDDGSSNYCPVVVEQQFTGIPYVDAAGVEYPVYVMDIYSYTHSADYVDASYFDKSTGTFHINVVYFALGDIFNNGIGLFGGGYEIFQLDGYDYNATIQYIGQFYPDGASSPNAVTNITIGSEATEARVAMKAGVSVEELVALIRDDQIEYQTLLPGTHERVEFPITTEGTQTIVAITYDGATPKSYGYTQFEFNAGAGSDFEAWEAFGMGIIVDGWVTAYYGAPFETSEGPVEWEDMPWWFNVERSVTNPGRYRLKNVFTDQDYCPWAYISGANANTTPTDIVIDAQNPNNVIIPPQFSGAATPLLDENNQQNYYPWYISNLAGLVAAGVNYGGMTLEDLELEGLSDKLVDGAIYVNFPCFNWVDGNYDEWGYIMADRETGQPENYSQIYIQNLDPTYTPTAAKELSMKVYRSKVLSNAKMMKNNFRSFKIANPANQTNGVLTPVEFKNVKPTIRVRF